MIEEFISKLEQQPDSIEFADTMNVIDTNYDFTPVEFNNSDINNPAGQNSGSCKIFAFGILHKLSEQQTLACFGKYYRDDVLNNPEATDHVNIRSFIKKGWDGISFTAPALAERS